MSISYEKEMEELEKAVDRGDIDNDEYEKYRREISQEYEEGRSYVPDGCRDRQ